MTDRKKGRPFFRLHSVFIGISVISSLIALSLVWWDGFSLPYVSDDFSYSADVVSTDSYYDQANERYSADRYSKASVHIDHVDNGSSIVQASATYISNQGESVANIQRRHPINTKNGQYELEKESYLFAPRELKKTDSFYYRHITYDAPALMRFVEEEKVHGLTVYHYQADYSEAGRIEQLDVPVDDLPEGQGLEYKPQLDIWVEPVSGWLVNYTDNTTVHYFDKASGETLSPYNHYSSRLTSASVQQHAAYAKTLKTKLTFCRVIAPNLALLIIFCIILAYGLARLKTSSRTPIYAGIAIGTVLSIKTLLGWAFDAESLTTLFGDKATNPMSATCFLLIFIAIWAFYKRKRPVTAFLGGLLLIITTLQLLGDTGIVPFQIDLLLFKNQIVEINQYIPARMSLYSTFALLLFGIGLIKIGFTSGQGIVHFARFTTGMTATLGVLGVFVQFLQLDQAFSILYIHSLSVIEAFLFVVCSFTLLQTHRVLHRQTTHISHTLKSMLHPALATIPLLLIGTLAQMQYGIVKRDLNIEFEDKIASIEQTITSRVELISNTLVGSRAFYTASNGVTSDQWQRFVNAYRLEMISPSLDVVGFAKTLPAGSTTVRASSEDEVVTIFPASSRPWIVPIVQQVSLHDSHNKKLGFDMFSDNIRSRAMEEAASTGALGISSRLQDTKSDTSTDDARILIIQPVYKEQPSVHLSTDNQSMPELSGFTYAIVDINRLVDSFMNEGHAPLIDFQIYNGLEPASKELLYKNTSKHNYTPRLTKDSTLFLEDHPWTISYQARPELQLSPAQEYATTIVLLGGSAIYFGLIVIISFLFDLERRGREAARMTDVHIKSDK